MQEQLLAQEHLVFKCLAGSYAYGTQIEGKSDIDTRGVFIAPPSHIVSVIQKVEQAEDRVQDVVIFELNKFMRLAAANNPNVLELLYMDPRDVLFVHPVFQRVIDNRHLFLSKKVRHTYSGYAFQQLKRMKGHKKWIMQPQPKDPPGLAEFCRMVKQDGSVTSDPEEIRRLSNELFLAKTFGSTQYRVFRSPLFFREKLGFFTENETQVRYVNISDEVLKERAEFVGFLFVNIDDYTKAHKTWNQYWEWKKNRNPARAELEEQSGYDSKHAMHLVRLWRTAEEILTTGQVHVRRPDAQELLSIRNGDKTYDEIIAWGESVDTRLEALYQQSTLQYSPDLGAIDNLYREVTLEYWREKGLI